MNNADLAQNVFSFLRQAGVNQVVVCAGARNAPLVMALDKEEFKVYNFFEERSAAFFALGLIKAHSRPVAVLTTSGTAAAELLPAAIEATYQGLPLVLVTADRPKNYRGTGSPQTIDQVGIFKNYVENEYDLDVQTKNFAFKWGYQKPIHLNVSFDEPLMDKPTQPVAPVKIEKTKFEHELSINKFTGSRPLIVLGEIETHHHQRVIEFILATQAPVYAETLSGLRYRSSLEPFLIRSSDQLVKEIFEQELCDSIIRIGGVPTLRFWRDLEKEFNDVSVVNYTNLPFSGLSRSTIEIEIEMLNPFQQFPADVWSLIKKMDGKLQHDKEKLFVKYPNSEQAFNFHLSQMVGAEALYLGNSLPIRNWDQFAIGSARHVYANRGANGIDGQISTYLGWSQNKPISYCVIGDLTAMYDMAAFGLTPQLENQKRHVVIFNNFGGQIFKRVFKGNDTFINPHKTQFYHLAKMWNWSYLLVSSVEDLAKIKTFNTSNVMIEIVPDATETEKFWNDWDELCKQIY